MLQKLRERAQNEKGFTLIELLVVILIIGILAAIAIPSFINQRGKGNDAEAKSAVVTATEATETCATDNAGSYANCRKLPAANMTALVDIEPTLNDVGPPNGTRLALGAVSANTTAATIAGEDCAGNPAAGSYAVCVMSTRSPTQVRFRLDRFADGTTVRSCTLGTETNQGGCPANSNWGQQ
ncbi:MAG: prepilin-type N-terminal cleavage/methylation domain-containing protein [Solirubrobacterales bacterium]